jgi:hypothetical protein
MAAFFRLMRASGAVALLAACGSSDGDGSLFGDNNPAAGGGAGTESDAASNAGGTSSSGGAISAAGGNGATSSSGGSINGTGGQPPGDGGSGALAGSTGSGGVRSDAAVPVGGDGGSNGRDAATCPGDQKFCEGLCVAFTPLVGCAAVDCAPCPAPPMNAVSVCIAEHCDFECTAGFARSGAGCVPTACDPAACPPCQNGSLPCCSAAGQCACRTAWNPFCG